MPRPSPVRDALRSVFAGDTHETWSLDQLLLLVRERAGAADYSTVFRAIGVLEAEGTVQKLDLGDGLSRYESVRAHHEHIQCDRCGRIAEVPGCVLEDAAAVIESSTGFRLSGHRVVFSGLCPGCVGRDGLVPGGALTHHPGSEV